ncbi:hypothetical protein SPSIL_007670 [Sporomusa silvacetica DSM 10669]|uniref:FlgN protein n=1 Tax=Sporomusa silvacetica DSM 10669 TaxID=1123289 RepID=A0ABZ3IGW4_9FIRM|nr:hypothetical protein [Sporomusa silvacetica]OZC16518.1 hypothetical protein SPSIL_38020 [Sporomusa silvacetica DSM 10669]
MGQGEEACSCLQRKLQILEQIAAKTETLCRFIPDRKMTGIRRVLGERNALIDELAAVNEEIAGNPAWKSAPGIEPLRQAAASKRREILERSRQVLQQAIEEKACIAAELKNSRIHRQVRNQYVTPYKVMLPGCRFNKKG